VTEPGPAKLPETGVPRVGLRIDDPVLADRVLAMLVGRDDILIADWEDTADVVITDAPSEGSAGRPSIVLADEAEAIRALQAGAAAVLPASAARSELLLAIEAVFRGLVILTEEVLESLIDPTLAAGHFDSRPASVALTARELEVLALLADGASNKVIARRLGISVHTAKFHVASILAKLDATGRTEAVAHAVRLGLVML
jgi:DNA-binding NarL/FixJ family response regulator